MSARQPLIGDILHIIGVGIDTNVQIVNILGGRLIINDRKRNAMSLVWNGNVWLIDGPTPIPIQMKLVDQYENMPTRDSLLYNDPRNLKTTHYDIVNLSPEQEMLRKEYSNFNRNLSQMRKQTLSSNAKKLKDDEELSMPYREQLQQTRANKNIMNEGKTRDIAAGKTVPKDSNPYVSHMLPLQPNQQSYPEDRPRMTQYTNPNENPQRFRLPKPKM